MSLKQIGGQDSRPRCWNVEIYEGGIPKNKQVQAQYSENVDVEDSASMIGNAAICKVLHNYLHEDVSESQLHHLGPIYAVPTGENPVHQWTYATTPNKLYTVLARKLIYYPGAGL